MDERRHRKNYGFAPLPAVLVIRKNRCVPQLSDDSTPRSMGHYFSASSIDFGGGGTSGAYDHQEPVECWLAESKTLIEVCRKLDPRAEL